MSDKKPFSSNLDRLKNKGIQNFTNDKESLKKTKNLLIKADEEAINEFKIIAFDYYKFSKQLSLFSFRHYLALVLYNLEIDFKEKYGKIEEPDKDYLSFYQKRGNKALLTREVKVKGHFTFILPVRFVELYYRLMHTYYINEVPHLASYSISIFFYYIVDYIKDKKLQFYDINI